MRSFSKSSIHSNSGNGNRSGFTIIELLVAAAVTAVLAGILLTMTNGVLRPWHKTTGSPSAHSEAQLTFDMLKEDLQSAVFRHDGGGWLAVEVLDSQASSGGRDWTVTSGSGSFKPDGNISKALDPLSSNHLPFDETRYGLGGTWLRFFTTAGGTQPRAVAYQLARRKITGNPTLNTNPAETRYMLYRS